MMVKLHDGQPLTFEEPLEHDFTKKKTVEVLEDLFFPTFVSKQIEDLFFLRSTFESDFLPIFVIYGVGCSLYLCIENFCFTF